MRAETIIRHEDDGSQTPHTLIPTAELDALRVRCASLQEQVVAIAGHFNGWANGDRTAENALFAIEEVLGPLWTDTVKP
jgi:hypothetical protein